MPPFKRLFVANRGEIAVRIVRACERLGIESVVAVSDADRDTLAARLATSAVCIGPAPAVQSYLKAEAVVAAAFATCGNPKGMVAAAARDPRNIERLVRAVTVAS